MQATLMLAELLRFNGLYLPKMIKDFPSGCYYVRPEYRGNPMIWLLGHIVLNRGEIVEMLGGDPRTGDLGDLFARGTIPENEPSKYPAPAELLKRFSKLVALTEQLIVKADPGLLDQKGWGRFESLGQNLAYSYMHETHHIGQISYLINLPAIRNIKKNGTSTFRKFEKKETTTKLILDGIKSVFT